MRGKKVIVLFFTMIICSCFMIAGLKSASCNEWPGVDETVVEKYAEKLGRSAREPYINTDQGDLLLFVFSLAGTIGGFIMGYSFRKFFHEPQQDHQRC